MNYTELTQCSFLLDEDHFIYDTRKILKQSICSLSQNLMNVPVLLVARCVEP